MKLINQILKIIVGLAIGCAAGYLIGGIVSMLISGISFNEFIDNSSSATNFYELIAVVITAVLGFITAIVLLIPVHEAGHLVAGLATGYTFVSFRIFNFTLIKVDGHFRLKRFDVAGTGGQCLLSPPDEPLHKVPVGWYNAGGVLANIIAGLLVTPLLFVIKNPFIIVFVSIFLLTDIIMILMNGIPMKLNGIANDAYNMLHLRNDVKAKQGMITALRSNALIQQGIRPKDMPEEWFTMETEIDWKNPLEVSIPLSHASLLIDRMEINKAKQEFESLYSHKQDIIQLYVNEIACELVFCALATGDTALAREVLNPKLQTYIQTYAKVMSGKQRTLFAIALYLDKDMEKAMSVYRQLEKNQHRYLLQGEVKSDLALMQYLISRHNLENDTNRA